LAENKRWITFKVAIAVTLTADCSGQKWKPENSGIISHCAGEKLPT